MRSDELINILAADNARVAPAVPQQRLAIAGLIGGLIALALVVGWLGLRPDLSTAVRGGFFWIKAAYTAFFGLAFGAASLALSRPERAPTLPWVIGGAGLAAFLALAALQFAPMDSAERVAALHGVSWTVCSRNILVLGAPLTVVTLLALRSLAPTRPMLAGLAAGLFSGGVAATIYGLHCPEATFVFVGLWYSLGVVLCGLLGAILGRFMLRW